MEDSAEESKKLVKEFLGHNAACCECNLKLYSSRSPPEKPIFVNLQLGIVLCEKCCAAMKRLGGRFANNVSYSELIANPPPMSSAKVIHSTNS